MSLMMACWKQNNFVEGLCSSEMQTFYSCVQKAQVSPSTHHFVMIKCGVWFLLGLAMGRY
uniref:Coiled-coil-helix-coiled-coil-helix domain containing 1 n=1 Tax=Periophthalmus magnuspinnatus TaxID=409849 RepID=A0A3B4AAV2_9GOBI